MTQLATMTSKRQLTIPAEIFNRLGWSKGQKFFISEEDGEVKLRPAKAVVSRLAGSVKIPQRYQGLSVDQIVEKAKQEHFNKKA